MIRNRTAAGRSRSFALVAVPAALALLLVVSGCAVAVTGGADYRPSLEMTGFTTFDWGEPDDLPTGDPRLDNNPFFIDRLHAAIEQSLEANGIRRSSDDPDLLVHHHSSVRNRMEIRNVDTQAGYTSPEYARDTEVFEYEEGTFLVDIADAESKEILWRGWAQADIEAALADPLQMVDLVERAVGKMFEFFPAEAPAA